ncbi:MAG: nuclear transport factor 2 family protein [Alphaproteobacteria bacterium]|nr:nuclear transport factor 2 family protein [Alphaproteobacteria bacterium]
MNRTEEATAIARPLINPAMALQKPLEDYIHFLERMTTRSLPLLNKLATPGMHFHDPLHDVHGVAAVMEVFAQKLSNLTAPRLRVKDFCWGREQPVAYLRWDLTGQKDGESFFEQGISEIMFSNDGYVMAHRDYLGSLVMPESAPTLLQRLRTRISGKLRSKSA